jgi:hypothetical protein
MTATTGGRRPDPIILELLKVLERYTQGITLAPDARGIIRTLLGNASLTIRQLPAGYRTDALNDAISRLDRVSREIRNEVDEHRYQFIDGSQLTELLRVRCPFPPFCYGDENEPFRAAGPTDVMNWLNRLE